MKSIGRYERRNRLGWLLVNEMVETGPGLFKVLHSEVTPANPNPTPSEWEYSFDGTCVRWLSNKQVLSTDTLRKFDIDKTPGFDLARHEAAYQKHLDDFFASYRAHQPPEPSEEERYEARAAHGPGVVLV